MSAALSRSSNTLARLSLAVVVAHALIGVVHSAAHVAMHIFMSLWQNAYIFAVIFALPVVAGLLLRRSARAGYLLLFLSMLGSLLFGVYYHFVAPGPDNVNSMGGHAWAFPFGGSAVLLALAEAAGAFLGLVGLLGRRR